MRVGAHFIRHLKHLLDVVAIELIDRKNVLTFELAHGDIGLIGSRRILARPEGEDYPSAGLPGFLSVLFKV
ncbi:hypothetical protein GCM10010982_19680 [Bowmanella pacifica]|uniref:Uncharacterized protein n=1 Tax=Bowmanella pacifica TaxID=502051 RepID=A0A917YX89_9ALTE|nr:hypothetical protein GCM10010982_19680 [Bowmanella pacifica]